MDEDYLYSHYIFTYFVKEKNKLELVTVIFCPQVIIDHVSLENDIDQFHRSNKPADKLIFILGSYANASLKKNIIDKSKDILKRIPRIQSNYYDKNVVIIEVDGNGNHSYVHNSISYKVNLDRLFTEGLTQLFIKRKGLVSSTDYHHYVFPSKKHAKYFLRPGNILLNSYEIYFIAFRALRYFSSKSKQIFCDTSSINSVAFAIGDLRNRFQDELLMPVVTSFSSYDGLEKIHTIDNDSLIIISASTSGDMIKRISDKKGIDSNNIVVLYYLHNKPNTDINSLNILCDLTYNPDQNPNGLQSFSTYNSEISCSLCDQGSIPINVEGDVFLNDRPTVNRIQIFKSDAPNNLSDFIRDFYSFSNGDVSLLRCYAQPDTDVDKRYEIFIDVKAVLDEIKKSSSPRVINFKEKLEESISRYISFDTTHLVYLNDEASKDLAEIIKNKFIDTFNKAPKLVSFEELQNVSSSEENGMASLMNGIQEGGVIALIASSLVGAGQLNYLSRLMRTHADKVRLVYFVGFARPCDKKKLDFIMQNLTFGKNKGNYHTFHAVETFFCSSIKEKTSWAKEVKFLKGLSDNSPLSDTVDSNDYVSQRLDYLQKESPKIGLVNKVFHCNPFNQAELFLGKNFAFLNFLEYTNDISQADVYFIISAVLNNLRSQPIDAKKTLKQGAYVRNLLCPSNFDRYNEGIIQASFLRAATEQELDYTIDEAASKDMTIFLLSLINHPHDQADGLLEFIYALAIKKMQLKNTDLVQIVNSIKDRMSSTKDRMSSTTAEYQKVYNEYLKPYVEYIEREIMQSFKPMNITNDLINT